jgi:hypothetical protein
VSLRGEVRARLASPGYWGSYGDALEHARYVKPTASRRRCHCGCKGRATHLGMANGVCLANGCELSMRRWARDPLDGAAAQFERWEAERIAKPNGAVRCSVPGCSTPDVPRPVGSTLASVRKALRPAGWTYDRRAGNDRCPNHEEDV